MDVLQDSDIIILDQYEYTGNADKIYFKSHHFSWCMSTVGNLYKVLMQRSDYSIIYIANEYYESRYQAIEPQLVGDVLILGMGLAILDAFLTTGNSWVWIENNEWLYNNITPANGTKARWDAEDEKLFDLFGTFDTILIDFPQTNGKLVDYTQYLNPGGNVIEMKL